MDFYVVIFISAFIILIAGFIQGLTSFGFALISMPLLSILIPLQQVVPIIVVLSLFTNIAVLYSCRKQVDLKKIWILILSSIAAAPIGALILYYISPSVLKVSSGLLIVAFAVILLRGLSFPLRNERMASIPVGIISGLLNGSISMSGPPIALFLSNQGVDKLTFRANITAYAIILNIITVSSYYVTGLLNLEVAIYISWMVPSMIVGVLLGILAVKKLNEATFKKLALWLIIVSGVWIVLSGFNIV